MSDSPTPEMPAVSVPLPWHAEAWASIGEQLAADRLPHALLLSGPRYCGKNRFALALARLLLRQDRNDAFAGAIVEFLGRELPAT